MKVKVDHFQGLDESITATIWRNTFQWTKSGIFF